MKVKGPIWTSHLTEQKIEDARFIIANGGSIEEAARRVGMRVEALERCIERSRP